MNILIPDFFSYSIDVKQVTFTVIYVRASLKKLLFRR